VQYTIVDDTHFKYAGFTDENLFGYYVTEEQGHVVRSLPLRSTCVFHAVNEVKDVLAWLRQLAEQRCLRQCRPRWRS
jgi:alpha-amylase